MKQKIEWYKEVLELEPGSRVFFPLAKLLAADGQIADAVKTLRQGLLRHPDHIESRLFLIELLHMRNAEEELGNELDGLGGLLAAYPGFWKAWSERLAQNPSFGSASLAMRFFIFALQGQQIDWNLVIEHGLAAAMNLSEQCPVRPFAGPVEPNPQPESPASGLDALQDSAGSQVSHLDPSTDEDETDEPFSLRTRSMAEVLAEQGDIAGALEIYNELLGVAVGTEKAELARRIEELGQRAVSPVTGGTKEDEKTSSGGVETSRLVTLLDSLAQRLEARAR